MNTSRVISLIGLGFGDCGKGLFTDALCRRYQAHTVVRFNGGAQAGHNVVLPDGRHHTFSQFGSGSFIPYVKTILAAPVIVHPTALLVENQFLLRSGISDGLERLLIDGRCKINTPFHQASGRLRELKRGNAAHGTCGVGVGETIKHSLEHPEQVLRYEDLFNYDLAFEKLSRIQITLNAEFSSQKLSPADEEEFRTLSDPSLIELWLSAIAPLLVKVPASSKVTLLSQLNTPGTIIFEGAQGVLLDESYGFHPHTTWSDTTPRAVEAILADLNWAGDVQHLGILRSYLTRHGNGPLPTFDPSLDVMAEPHNSSSGLQGLFRRGHPDKILLQYAMAVTGPLDGLLISHLDKIHTDCQLRWCEGYRTKLGEDVKPQFIAQLPFNNQPSIEDQVALTHLLCNAVPIFSNQKITSITAYLEQIEEITQTKILFTAHGPTFMQVYGKEK